MIRFLIAIIGVAIAGGIFFFYTKPAYDSTRSIASQISEYNLALDKAAELQKLRQALLSRYNALDPNDIARLQKLLPDHVDNVRLILDLDNLASAHGFTLQNVSVSGSRAAEDSDTPLGTIGSNSQQFDSLTFGFSTTGTYPAFLQFMESLERTLRIVDLVSLSLSPANAGVDTKLPEPVYSYSVTVKTYWLK